MLRNLCDKHYKNVDAELRPFKFSINFIKKKLLLIEYLVHNSQKLVLFIVDTQHSYFKNV